MNKTRQDQLFSIQAELNLRQSQLLENQAQIARSHCASALPRPHSASASLRSHLQHNELDEKPLSEVGDYAQNAMSTVKENGLAALFSKIFQKLDFFFSTAIIRQHQLKKLYPVKNGAN
ncbi:MAG: hypothetical protein QNJ65_10520 [Xenococcaceae cyanobacterium MO_234.B1]|nr:hypothetical protein [Xenococcaceae cyanobacterium MO_234.B1]